MKRIFLSSSVPVSLGGSNRGLPSMLKNGGVFAVVKFFAFQVRFCRVKKYVTKEDSCDGSNTRGISAH